MLIYLLYGLIAIAALGWVGMAPRLPVWSRWLGYIGLTLAMAGLLWTVPEPYRLFGDFTKAYYFAGQQVLQGSRELYSNACVRGYVNIPIVAYLFAPFALFSPTLAGWVMALVGIGATIAAGALCLRLTEVTGWRRALLIGLFVANGSIYYNLRLGNTTQYVLLLLIGAVMAVQQRRRVLAGALVAIAGVIKIPILLLGGYFLVRERGRVLAGFGLGLGTIGVASLLLFGPESHVDWYQQCVQPFAGRPLSAFNVQSVDGVLARLLGGRPNTWVPMSVDWTFKLLRYGALGLLVGSVGMVLGRARRSTTLAVELLEWMVVLCLALLISPVSWTHYYLLLLLPIALVLGGQLPLVPDRAVWVSFAIGVVLVSLPVKLIQSDQPWLNALTSRLLLSHYFLGGLLLLGGLLVSRWQLPQPTTFDRDRPSVPTPLTSKTQP